MCRSFKTAKEAGEAFDKIALYLYGEDAVLNYQKNKEIYLKEDLLSYYSQFINNNLPNKATNTQNFGFHYSERLKKWETSFPVFKKGIYLGIYDTKELAGEMVDEFIVYFDLDRALNFPEKIEFYKTLDLETILKTKIGKGDEKKFDKVAKKIYALKQDGKLIYRNKRQINTKI